MMCPDCDHVELTVNSACQCGCHVPARVSLPNVRQWFLRTELAQAADTLRVVQGIIEARKAASIKRKRRSDAGRTRTEATLFPSPESK